MNCKTVYDELAEEVNSNAINAGTKYQRISFKIQF